jgi:hypothetical protein
LITNDGLEEIKSVDYMDEDYNTPLYNLVLDGDHTYYANGYLVHNKTKPTDEIKKIYKDTDCFDINANDLSYEI